MKFEVSIFDTLYIMILERKRNKRKFLTTLRRATTNKTGKSLISNRKITIDLLEDISEFGDGSDRSINLERQSSLDVTTRMEKDIKDFFGRMKYYVN